ncbi:hypothetical protein BT69DRAFT_1287901, partial [Atractiella rhizophila]
MSCPGLLVFPVVLGQIEYRSNIVPSVQRVFRPVFPRSRNRDSASVQLLCGV